MKTETQKSLLLEWCRAYQRAIDAGKTIKPEFQDIYLKTWEYISQAEALQVRKAARQTDDFLSALEEAGGPGKATVEHISSLLGVSHDTVERRVSKAGLYRHRGVILATKPPSEAPNP